MLNNECGCDREVTEAEGEPDHASTASLPRKMAAAVIARLAKTDPDGRTLVAALTTPVAFARCTC